MEEEDSHYCLRCRSTIQGLDNYVHHRREKCQIPKAHEPSTATALHSYLNVNRNGSSSNSLMTRNYLVYPPSKSNRSDPVLSSSSNHIEAERYNKTNQDANEHQNSLGVADLSVEVSADDFMNHLGLCMVSSNNWNSDMNSEEPLRADDFFTLLELQSCTKSSSDRPQRPRRSTEPIPIGSSERLRSSSDVFVDLNSSHDSTSALELTGSEECLESNTATFDILPNSEPSSNNVSGETLDSPSPTLPLLPPSPTKLSFPSRGKWMPGLKPRDIHKSGSSVEYHCKPCNRRLTGRAVFEKHLQSELHFKRSAQHNQPSSPPLQHYGLRQKKTDAPLEEKDESADKQVISSPVRAGQAVLIDELDDEESDMWWMKRKKKGEKNARRCPICSVWVSQSLLGKHLVSRYHVNRSRNHPQRAQCILDNIHLIVLEAPFQCRLCRFYCHSHYDLLAHWKSTDHKGRDSETGSSRTYFCSVCRMGQLNCALMHNHLESERHLSIVDIVNKSVAVVISKLEPVQCHLCRVPSFRYRVQLNQHLAAKHSVPVGSISSICGRVFSCDHCTYKTPSSKAYTYHVFSCKAAPATGIKYRCLICDLSFSTKEESVRHRSTQEHRDTAGLKRSNPGSSTSSLNTRSCPHCYRSFNDLTGLKEHFLADHPDLLPRCTRCGATFALKQQLSAHRRTVCQAVAESSTDVPAALFACNLCPYSCRIRADLLYHQAVEHREEVVGRDDGDTSSTSNAASTGPDNTSWTKQQHLYRCPDCGQGYGTKFSLKAHLVSHTGELAFRCHHCGRHFEREEERLAHIRQLHAPRPNIKGIQPVTPSAVPTSSKRKRHSIPDAQQSSSSTPSTSTVVTEIPCAPESS